MKNQYESFEKDDQTRHILQKAGTEEPSWNFTASIMQKIHAEIQHEAFRYKPAISPKGWLFVGLSISLLLALILILPSGSSKEFVGFKQFVSPVQNMVTLPASGFFKKLQELSSVPGIFSVLLASWLLFLADKWRNKKTLSA